MNEAMVQSPRAAADVEGEPAQDLGAVLGVHHFRMEQETVDARSTASMATIGAEALVADVRKPGGTSATSSPWLAHTRNFGRQPVEQPGTGCSSTCTCACPNPGDPIAHGAAEHAGQELHAVADAEDRHARVHHTRIANGGVDVGHALGPPDRMMPAGLAFAQALDGRVEREDLGVDGQLAQPARNELGVLRPEVEDDDGLMRHDRSGGNRYYKWW
jgi:hypothetical protein